MITRILVLFSCAVFAIAQEQPVSGSAEVGYRANSTLSGNLDSYRSVMNLGEGPRLVGLDLRGVLSGHEFNIDAGGWGGDPAGWMFLRAYRPKLYDLNAQHRDLAYFNALPSFANPQVGLGVLLNQHSFDINRRLSGFDLKLLPGAHVEPFISWQRDSGTGRGSTTFVTATNEYPVRSLFDDRTSIVRGGAVINAASLVATVEQSHLAFDNAQTAFDSQLGTGNRTAPFLGQNLFLRQLDQQWAVSGKGNFSRAAIAWSPKQWIGLGANYRFSQLNSDVQYRLDAAGRFGEIAPVVITELQRGALTTEITQPQHEGEFTADIRPHSRLRVIETWRTSRFHIASLSRLELTEDRQHAEVLWDATRWLTLRGGHRYTNLQARTRAPQLAATLFRDGASSMNAAVAGAVVRPAASVRLDISMERAGTDQALLRLALEDYTKGRARARWTVNPQLQVSLQSGILRNHTRFSNWKLQQHDIGASVDWIPTSQRFSVVANYAYSVWKSDARILDPGSLQQEASLFRDRAHSAGATVTFQPPGLRRAALSGGGALVRSTGSRAIQWYQPVGAVRVPVTRFMDWKAEWRWHGFAQPMYPYEDFRLHQLMFSVRFYRPVEPVTPPAEKK